MQNTYLDTKIKNTCNGCGVCAFVCPQKCIKMIEDGEGFLYPEIDENKCIKCNKCRKLCGNFNEKKEKNEKAYACINKSEEQLQFASSGGIFYILAEYVIKNDGVVFGVAYNKELMAIHDFAETLQECKKFCGSKYVRSDLQNSYQNVKLFLENGREVLFTGTACQISGLKKYLGKNYKNLILCDILCHANPSPKVFKLYKENLEKIENRKISNVLFRSKETGWRNQIPIIEYENNIKKQENTYFKAFVSEMINRPSCNSCKFASKRRISDFTIGDFWGIEKVNPDIDTKNGVSLLNVNSNKGFEIFDKIKEKMNSIEVDYDLAASFNHYSNVLAHKNRDKFFKNLSIGKIDSNNIIDYMNKYTKKPFYRKILVNGKRIIKNILINRKKIS